MSNRMVVSCSSSPPLRDNYLMISLSLFLAWVLLLCLGRNELITPIVPCFSLFCQLCGWITDTVV